MSRKLQLDVHRYSHAVVAPSSERLRGTAGIV